MAAATPPLGDAAPPPRTMHPPAPLYGGCRLLSRDAALAMKVMLRLALPEDLAHEVALWREELWMVDAGESCTEAALPRVRHGVLIAKVANDFRVYRPFGVLLRCATATAIAAPAAAGTPAETGAVAAERVVALRITKSPDDLRPPRASLRSGVYKIAVGPRDVLATKPAAQEYPTPPESMVLSEGGAINGVASFPFPDGLPSPATVVLRIRPYDGVVVVTVDGAGCAGGNVTFAALLPEALRARAAGGNPPPEPAVLVCLNRDGDSVEVLSATDGDLDFYFRGPSTCDPPRTGPPAALATDRAAAGIVAEATPMFCALFASVLGRAEEDVRPDDSFAALGAMSLHTVQAVSRLRHGAVAGRDIRVPLALFEVHDSPRQLAGLYAAAVLRTERKRLRGTPARRRRAGADRRGSSSHDDDVDPLPLDTAASNALGLCDCLCVCLCDGGAVATGRGTASLPLPGVELEVPPFSGIDASFGSTHATVDGRPAGTSGGGVLDLCSCLCVCLCKEELPLSALPALPPPGSEHADAGDAQAPTPTHTTAAGAAEDTTRAPRDHSPSPPVASYPAPSATTDSVGGAASAASPHAASVKDEDEDEDNQSTEHPTPPATARAWLYAWVLALCAWVGGLAGEGTAAAAAGRGGGSDVDAHSRTQSPPPSQVKTTGSLLLDALLRRGAATADVVQPPAAAAVAAAAPRPAGGLLWAARDRDVAPGDPPRDAFRARLHVACVLVFLLVLRARSDRAAFGEEWYAVVGG